MNPRTKLAALFLPTRRLIGSEPPVIQSGGALGGQQWVVPRAECQYRRVDLVAMPPRQRAAAARLAATRYQPSQEAVAYVAWLEGIAHLWIWTSPPPEVASGEQRWIPESLLLPPPAEDGPRLLQLARGAEGQVWEGGQLVQSQWWPAVPDAAAWHRFLRAGGLEAIDASVPEPASLPWSPRWAQAERAWLPGSSAGRERLAWLTVCAVLTLALGWQLTGLLRWSVAGASLAAELEATRTEMAPLLAARERAERAQADADRLRQLQSGASDYELMARVVSALPEGIRLNSWHRQADKLQVLVSGGDADPRKYVAAFAGEPELAELSATPVAIGMELVFTLPARGGVAR